MTEQDRSAEFRWVLRDRVGGFLRNTRHESGITCSVCSVPTSGGTCTPCREQRVEFGHDLADHVVTLAYVRGQAPGYHQSAYLMRTYKQAPEDGKSRDDLALLVTAATYIHARCVRDTTGMPWPA